MAAWSNLEEAPRSGSKPRAVRKRDPVEQSDEALISPLADQSSVSSGVVDPV